MICQRRAGECDLGVCLRPLGLRSLHDLPCTYLCCPPGQALSGSGVMRSLLQAWLSPEAPGKASPHCSRVPTTPTMALKEPGSSDSFTSFDLSLFSQDPVTTRLLHRQHGSCCMRLWQGVYIPGRLRITASAALQTIRTRGIRERPGDMT